MRLKTLNPPPFVAHKMTWGIIELCCNAEGLFRCLLFSFNKEKKNMDKGAAFPAGETSVTPIQKVENDGIQLVTESNISNFITDARAKF